MIGHNIRLHMQHIDRIALHTLVYSVKEKLVPGESSLTVGAEHHVATRQRGARGDPRPLVPRPQPRHLHHHWHALLPVFRVRFDNAADLKDVTQQNKRGSEMWFITWQAPWQAMERDAASTQAHCEQTVRSICRAPPVLHH